MKGRSSAGYLGSAWLAAALLVSGCAPSSSSPVLASHTLRQAYSAHDSVTAPSVLDSLFHPEWPQPYRDPAHTGYSAVEKTLNRANVGSLTELWSFATGGQITSPIIYQRGGVFFTSGDGYLYSINEYNGTLRWKYQTYEGVGPQNAPAFVGDYLVVPCMVADKSQQNGICDVKFWTGKRVWSYYINCHCDPPASVTAGAVVAGYTIVFDYTSGGTDGSHVVALNARGSVLWTSPTLPPAPVFSESAVYQGQVFYSDGNGVCAASLATGAQIWCTDLGSNTSISVSKGIVYVNTLSNGVFALNASTGSQLWQFTPTAGNSSGYYDPPAISDRVYVSGIGSGGNLYALNPSTGAQMFNTSGDGSTATTDSPPSVANGVVYSQCQSGLCAYNSATGALLFAAASSPSQNVPPVIVKGVVYTTCGTNDICAYALPTGMHSRHGQTP